LNPAMPFPFNKFTLDSNLNESVLRRVVQMNHVVSIRPENFHLYLKKGCVI
jgi:hypothetical protein